MVLPALVIESLKPEPIRLESDGFAGLEPLGVHLLQTRCQPRSRRMPSCRAETADTGPAKNIHTWPPLPDRDLKAPVVFSPERCSWIL